ncbi:MAG: CocE/NonD family hydrolase [Burkholderiales bacterium]|nr:CocE/NonD family hydrolase [Burkholderiales bacterium]
MQALKSEIRDGMRIDWDMPIQMDDGLLLRADIFRPTHNKKCPVILSYGPYGKGLSFQEGYKTAWEIMERENPDVIRGSSNKYQNWEVVDPEKWVPDDYICIRIDSRGAGRSPGFMDHNNARETKDIHLCIEWAAKQSWCNGKVGMNGISYYASNQWRAAASKPKHLAAICVWEGWNDNYRESNRHGGIACSFRKNWLEMQIKTVQHGVGDRGKRSPITGDTVCGPETLSPEQLLKNVSDIWKIVLENEFISDWYKERSANLDRVDIPVLSAANWGGQGLHTRGNFEGFVRSKSKQKWLEVHGGSHWAPFYIDYGVALQKRFFDHYLKGKKNGWKKTAPISLLVRSPGEKFVQRDEKEWPLKRTQWTTLHLNPQGMTFSQDPITENAQVTYDMMGDGVTFAFPPQKQEVELTGPMALKLFISSTTVDADIFAVVRIYDKENKEVLFHGALDPKTPVAQGWLRASHRKLDKKKSLPYRPWHTHDQKQALVPGQVYELDVEIWPTCIVVPVGYRIALTIRGKDYEHDGAAAVLSNMKNPMKGCGPFVHDDEVDRPPAIFGGKVTLHMGPKQKANLLLPVIPKKK